MSETDKFMQSEFLSFYQRVMTAFEKNHPALFATFSHLVPAKIRFGMRVTDHDIALGDYTFELDNGRIAFIENGVLAAEIHTPFGEIKPYYIVEKITLEKMIQDEPAFVAHPFVTKFKYLPEVTIKFHK